MELMKYLNKALNLANLIFPINILIILICIITVSICILFHLDSHNRVEIAAEKILHMEGVDIDFDALYKEIEDEYNPKEGKP